jgi:hypothetical protein
MAVRTDGFASEKFSLAYLRGRRAWRQGLFASLGGREPTGWVRLLMPWPALARRSNYSQNSRRRRLNRRGADHGRISSPKDGLNSKTVRFCPHRPGCCISTDLDARIHAGRGGQLTFRGSTWRAGGGRGLAYPYLRHIYCRKTERPHSRDRVREVPRAATCAVAIYAAANLVFPREALTPASGDEGRLSASTGTQGEMPHTRVSKR